MKYFEVFYPDGKKGVFGYENNSTNRVMYPLWSLTDLYGNKIDYTYAEGNNLFRLEKINYNAASIEFRYKTRSDGIVSFCGGLQTNIGYSESNNLQGRDYCQMHLYSRT